MTCTCEVVPTRFVLVRVVCHRGPTLVCPEYGNSVPSGASASGEGEGEEHSIVVDAFFEGNPVGTYSNTDFEEKAAIIEQIYFAATQDDDAETLMIVTMFKNLRRAIVPKEAIREKTC